MSFVGNLLWFVLGGGLIGGLVWLLVAAIYSLTIIGIPFGVAAYRIARFVFFPFGKQLVHAELVGETAVKGSGIGNVIWVIFSGFWLALGHALGGVLCCISIIGIPFGLAHFKLAQASFAPLGKRIVSSDVAIAARMHHAKKELSKRLDAPHTTERSVTREMGADFEAVKPSTVTPAAPAAWERKANTPSIPQEGHIPPLKSPSMAQQLDRAREERESVPQTSSAAPGVGKKKSSAAYAVLNWLPTLIGYGVWFALLVIFRKVVLSMPAVQQLGVALRPFATDLYPRGLLWTQFIDAGFSTVILFSVLSLGGCLRHAISMEFHALSRLGNVVYLGSMAAAVTIGYYAYSAFILPPLRSQGVEWGYELVLLVLLGGIAATALYEVVRLITELT